MNGPLIEFALARLRITTGDRVRQFRLAAAVAAVAICVTIAIASRMRHVMPAMDSPARLSPEAGFHTMPAISPDSASIVFSSDLDPDGEFKGHLNLWKRDLKTGRLIRLTCANANHTDPAISADGKVVLFRTDEESGQLALVPASGGGVRILRGLGPGREPRFAPKGHWAAYWIAEDNETQDRGRVQVVDLAAFEDQTYQPHRAFAEFAHAIRPLWSDDGRLILAFGTWRSGVPEKEYDAWILPMNNGYSSGEPLKTGLFPALKAQGVYQSLTARGKVIAGEWTGGYLYFSASSDRACDLWRIRLGAPDFKARGPAERITRGASCDTAPRLSPDNMLVFASHDAAYHLYTVEAPKAGQPISDDLLQLTNEPGINLRPTVSRDGSKLAWESKAYGKLDRLLFRDLHQQLQKELAQPAAIDPDPTNSWSHLLLTPDGSKVAYRIAEGKRQAVFLENIENGETQPICADCGAPLSWIGENEKLLYQTGGMPSRIGLLDLKSKQHGDWLIHPSYSLYAAKPFLSTPGNGWLTFYADNGPRTRQIFVAPVRAFEAAPFHEWIPITDGAGWDLDPVWGADGNVIYFLSNRDGHRCIWGQLIDVGSKRPAGEPFAVGHFHSMSRTLMGTVTNRGAPGLTLTAGRLFFALEQRSATLWSLNLPN